MDKRFAWSFDLRTKKFVPTRKTEQDYVVPLSTVVDLQKLLRWFSAHPEAKDFLDTASALAKSIREYKIPAYLVQSSDETALRDIFDRIAIRRGFARESQSPFAIATLVF